MDYYAESSFFKLAITLGVCAVREFVDTFLSTRTYFASE